MSSALNLDVSTTKILFSCASDSSPVFYVPRGLYPRGYLRLGRARIAYTMWFFYGQTIESRTGIWILEAT